MIHIIVVSHSMDLAKAVVHFASEMKGEDDFQVRAVSGIEGDSSVMGSDPMMIKRVIEELDDGDGVLLLGDVGSSVMNIEMAIELLADDLKERVVFADAPIVEGALTAVSFNGKNVSMAALLEEVESTREYQKKI